jgi:hypothetical protein
VAAAVAVAGLALVGWPSAAAAGTSTSTSSTSSSTTAVGVASTAAASSSARSVTLVTGDRVTVNDIGGRTSYAVVGKAGGSGLFDSYQTPAGEHYLIPAEAVPYLGRQLDAALFDVTALLRDGLTSGSRIPVSLSFASGVAPAAPPGVTLTSVGTTSATGYLTATSGTAFAAGLKASIGADVQAGRQPGTGPLFGGLASISLGAPGVAGQTVQPRLPLHILQMNASDLTGAPVNAFAILLNTDSISRANAFLPIMGGIARVAVPAGNYSAVVSFNDFDAQGNVTANRLVSLGDFAVAATGTTTVAADERSATVPITVTTPRPAVQDEMDVGWWRKDAAGNSGSLDFQDFGSGPPYFINTQSAVTTGSFRLHVQWGGSGPSTGPAYRYDVAYGSDAILANQTYPVRPDQLATIQQTFYSDPASTGGTFLNGPQDGFLPGYSMTSGGELYSGPLTQYIGGGADQWWQSYSPPTGVEYFGDLQTFRPGREYRLEWAHGPLAPNVGRHVGPTSYFACFACASGTALGLGFSLSGDSEPDHTAFSFFSGTTHYTVYQNGAVVFDKDNYYGATLTGIPTTPTTYREVYDTDYTGTAGVSQSTSTHTDVTFTYRPGTDPRDTLPSADQCDYTQVVTAPCQVLPVLSLGYHLAADYTNTSDSALQSMTLDVSHLSYDGRGPRARITSATVSVSFDGGATWQPAAVFGASGHYWALWQNPRSAAGTSPALKVTATDAIGGSITQTVANAYTIAKSVH